MLDLDDILWSVVSSLSGEYICLPSKSVSQHHLNTWQKKYIEFKTKNWIEMVAKRENMVFQMDTRILNKNFGTRKMKY